MNGEKQVYNKTFTVQYPTPKIGPKNVYDQGFLYAVESILLEVPRFCCLILFIYYNILFLQI